MIDKGSNFLLLGAALNAVAAALHLGCIAFGASWYRFFGAGERMAQMAAAGRWSPTIITSGIAVVLSAWAVYALSGAGVMARLPWTREVLCVVAGIYLVRGIVGFPMILLPTEQSAMFWVWSSAVSLALGLVHAVGVWQRWSRL